LGYFGGRTIRENKLGGITFDDRKCRFLFMELYGVCNKSYTLRADNVCFMTVTKYVLLISALIEMNVMSTRSSGKIITRWPNGKDQNMAEGCLFNHPLFSLTKCPQINVVEGGKSKGSKNNNEDKAVALIGIVGGICLILFRKRIVRDILQLTENWVKASVPPRESKVRLKRTEIVRFSARFFEVGITVFGILIITMALPSFVPPLHRAVSIVFLSFFFIFLPAILGSSVLTLVLYPLWGWRLRKYRKDHSSMSQQTLISKSSKGNDENILQKLQNETNRYGMMCSIIIFIIFSLIAIKITLVFDIFNKL
jgi:hypothetical protein